MYLKVKLLIKELNVKIQNINSVNFGKYNITSKVESGEEDFRYLSKNNKLLVIYDMLQEQKETLHSLSNKQYDSQEELKNDLKKLSLNQQKMHKSAMQAAIWMSSQAKFNDTADAISDQLYYGKKIDIVG